MVHGYELTIRTGEQAGRSLRIEPGQRLLLGRGRDVAIRVRDGNASRHHAALELTPTGLSVTDLGSRNGTLLDGRELVANQPRQVEQEGTLQIGAFVLLLRRRDGRDEAQAAEPLLRDDYDLLGELGRGGFGAVYAARHRQSGQRVAIKALLQELEHDPMVRARMMREANVRVESPYLVQTHEVRSENSQIYLVLELVEGSTLDQLLGGQPLPLPQALAIGEGIARGLEALHGAGYVHRDVKPGNVFVLRDGGVKLGDFGIVLALDATQHGPRTKTAGGMATLQYVAPEQTADAKRVEPTADLYSLGATLYHALAGRAPFAAVGGDILIAIWEADPRPLRELRPDCPQPVADLIHRLLAKDPDDRPPEAEIVADELRALRAEHCR